MIDFALTAGHKGHQFPFVETGAASFREVLAGPRRFPRGFPTPVSRKPTSDVQRRFSGHDRSEYDLRYLEALSPSAGSQAVDSPIFMDASTICQLTSPW